MEDVAGYRVLRSAGHGERARLLLGFDEGRTVVLKVCASGDPARQVEIEALARAAGEHVVGLEDVASDGRDAVLVLERLPGGSLAELLERRGTLDAGEAVTILAPLAATLDRIHAAGVAHGALSLGAVCFREDGAPTLTGFGRAELFAPGSPEVVRETVAGVLDDREALRRVAAIVLGRVAGERAAASARVAGRLAELTPDQLASALFDLATPSPVRVDGDAADVDTVRVGEPLEVAVVDEERPVLPPWLSALMPDGLRDRVVGPLERARGVWAGWHPRRRRLVLGAVAGGLTVLAAVAFVPTGPAEPTVAPPTPASPVAAEDAADLPEDPVEAAILLLALRERCVRDLAVLCLDDVAQPGSSAYDDDVALIRAIEEGGEYRDDGILDGRPVLVEQLGDSALLDLPAGSHPGSLLLLRTTDGWRIRDYLDAPAG